MKEWSRLNGMKRHKQKMHRKNKLHSDDSSQGCPVPAWIVYLSPWLRLNSGQCLCLRAAHKHSTSEYKGWLEPIAGQFIATRHQHTIYLMFHCASLQPHFLLLSKETGEQKEEVCLRDTASLLSFLPGTGVLGCLRTDERSLPSI